MVLDKLEDEVAPKEMIDQQRAMFESWRGVVDVARNKYIEIGKKLTSEGREYLK